MGALDVDEGMRVREEVVRVSPVSGERLHMLPLDVCNDASVAAAADDVKRRYGSLVGLCNCAGIGTGASAAPVQDSAVQGRTLTRTHHSPTARHHGGSSRHEPVRGEARVGCVPTDAGPRLAPCQRVVQ